MFLIAILYLIITVFIILFTFFSTPFVVPSAAALIILVFCLYRTYHSGKWLATEISAKILAVATCITYSYLFLCVSI